MVHQTSAKSPEE